MLRKKNTSNKSIITIIPYENIYNKEKERYKSNYRISLSVLVFLLCYVWRFLLTAASHSR
jgi:hypothetical protein